jgi:hypothetical protein
LVVQNLLIDVAEVLALGQVVEADLVDLKLIICRISWPDFME